MMHDLLIHPGVQSGVLPFVLAAMLTGAAHVLAGRRGAQASILLAYLAASVVVFGWPAFPPVGSTQKLPYVALGCLAATVLLSAAAPQWRLLAALASFAAAGGWIAAPRLAAGSGAWLPALLVGITSSAALVGLGRSQEDEAVEGGVALLATAIGLGVVALLGGSASIFQSALAVAAATGGLLAWNWPHRRHRIGTAILFAGVLLAALAVQLVFFTRASPWAAAALLPVIAIPPLLGRLHWRQPWRRPLAVGAAAALPFTGAVLIALAAGGSAYTG
jgi:hypothetical protein